MRAAHLAKQHGDQVIPAAEPLGRSLSRMLLDGPSKGGPINQGQYLGKATCNGDHRLPPVCEWHGADTPWTGGAEQPILLTGERHFKNLFWTRVGLTPLISFCYFVHEVGKKIFPFFPPIEY
jgi:hypothetical protein